MSTEHASDRWGSVRRGGIVLGLLAVVLLAHPVYLWPRLGSDPNEFLAAGFVRPILTMVGAALLTYGGLVTYREEWRPLTPRTAVLFPVVVGLAVLGLQWYTEAVLGLVALQPLDNNPVLVGSLSVVFLVGGSLARRGRKRAVTGFALGCLAVFLLGVVVDGTRLPIALVSGVALGAAGAVIGGVGYVLTAPSSPVDR